MMISRGKPSGPEPEPEPLVSHDRGDERERERLWVTECLEGIGLPYPLALELALTKTDWHKVEKAWKNGATLKDIQEVFL